MSAQPTPRPWTFDEHGGTFYIHGPCCEMVADHQHEDEHVVRIRGVGRGATPEEQRANAELIVRAVNSHEDLVAAANGLRWLQSNIHNYGTQAFREYLEAAAKDAARAVAKSEVRQ